MAGGDGLDSNHNLRVVLGPCMQCCPCEASEEKMGQKSTAKRNEIELSFYIIRLFSTNELDHTGLFWAENWLFWPYFLRYGLQTCFADYLN